MRRAFSKVLYYPTIDVANERWLRSAALFWDSIRTIAPVSYRVPYSSDFARVLYDEGVLNPVRVSSDMEEVEELTDKVLEYLTDPAAAGVMLGTDQYSRHRIHSEKISYQLRELAKIHPDKLSHRIRLELEEGINDGDWLHVTPGFANFYMTLLATQLAERLGLGLVTESSAADQLAITVRKGKPLGDSTGRRPGRQFDAHGPRRSLPADLAPSLLIDLIVEGISLPQDISAHELLEFKDYHAEELAVFRVEVARLASDLPEGVPVEALRQEISDRYKSHVLPAMHSLKTSLKAQKWESGINGLLKVSCITIPPTSAAILAGMPTSIALIAGAGISMTASAVLWANQRRQTMLGNPYSYLLSIERQW